VDTPLLKVVTPAASQLLTTLARVKLELGITDATHDDLLDIFVRDASARAATYCRRVFMSERVSEQFRAASFSDASSAIDFPMQLMLSRLPVTNIVSVTVDGEILVEDTDFETELDLGYLWRLESDVRTFWQFSKATIVYDGGFTSATLPADVEKGVVALAKASWFAKTQDPAIQRESTPGVYDVTYRDGGGDSMNGGLASPDARAWLDPFRLIRFY